MLKDACVALLDGATPVSLERALGALADFTRLFARNETGDGRVGHSSDGTTNKSVSSVCLASLACQCFLSCRCRIARRVVSDVWGTTMCLWLFIAEYRPRRGSSVVRSMVVVEPSANRQSSRLANGHDMTNRQVGETIGYGSTVETTDEC